MSSYNKPHLRNDSVPPFSLFPSILTKLKTCSHIFTKILILTGIFTTLIWEYHYLYTVHQFKSFIETVSVIMAALKAMSCIRHVNRRFFTKEWSLWVFSRAQKAATCDRIHVNGTFHRTMLTKQQIDRISFCFLLFEWGRFIHPSWLWQFNYSEEKNGDKGSTNR